MGAADTVTHRDRYEVSRLTCLFAVDLSDSSFLSYRVNIFGFPNAKGLENQNVGFLDQRLA